MTASVPGRELRGRALADGSAAGTALVLDEPLSLWGGLDPVTGRLIDPRHPQFALDLRGRVVLMPSGRGSSSSSTVLAEAIRLGTAPAAVAVLTPDPIIAIGSIVAAELYGTHLPVVALDPAGYASIGPGDEVTVEAKEGRAVVRLGPSAAQS